MTLGVAPHEYGRTYPQSYGVSLCRYETTHMRPLQVTPLELLQNASHYIPIGYIIGACGTGHATCYGVPVRGADPRLYRSLTTDWAMCQASRIIPFYNDTQRGVQCLR